MGYPRIVMMGLLAVSHLPGDRQRRHETETPETSTRKREVNEVITHFVIIELSGGARRRLGLCYRENTVQGVNKRIDTSRSSSSCALCPPDLDFPGSSYRA